MKKFLITRVDTSESADSRNIPRAFLESHDTYEDAIKHVESCRMDREYQIWEAVCNFSIKTERVKMPIM